MKQITIFFYFFSLITTSTMGAIIDPVADYLRPDFPYAFADNTTHEGPYYSSDIVFRYDVDLNQDGKKEVLVSLSRDRDGKQGNIFYAYKKVNGGYKFIPPTERKDGNFIFLTMLTLNPNGFYLGRIDEINDYGIIKWGTAGGGEGGFTAYIFDGEKIVEKNLGDIERNKKTYELEGKGIEIAAKYFPSVSDAILDKVERLRAERGYKPNRSAFVSPAKEIGSDELSRKYGVRVDPRTYQQAFEEEMAKESKTSATPTPSSK